MTIPEGLLDFEPDNDEFGCYAEPILQLLIERPDVVGPQAAKITPALFPLSELRCKYIAAAIGVLREKFRGPLIHRVNNVDWVAKPQILLLDHQVHPIAESFRDVERRKKTLVDSFARRLAK